MMRWQCIPLGIALAFTVPEAHAQQAASAPASIEMPLLPAPVDAVKLPEVQVPSVATDAEKTTDSTAPDSSEAQTAKDAPTSKDGAATGEDVLAKAGIAPEPTKATEPAAVDDEPDENFAASYGTFDTSLMFQDEDVQRMKQVLYLYESLRGKPQEGVAENQTGDEFGKILDTLQEDVPLTPLETYPTFYVSSIIYHGSKDWVLWLNGERVTPKKMPADIDILRVSEHSVAFEWKPSNFVQFKSHWNDVKAGRAEKAPKTSASQFAAIQFDKKKKSWRFTVNTNQTFVSAYMAVMEGNQSAVTSTGETTADASSSATPFVRQLSDTPGRLPPLISAAPSTQNGVTMTPATNNSKTQSKSSTTTTRSGGLVSDVPQSAAPSISSVSPAAAAALSAIPPEVLQQAISQANKAATSGDTGTTAGLPVLPSQ